MTWDPMDCLSHRSLRANTSRIHSTWPSLGYGLLSIKYSMPMLPCSLCMICLFLCLFHAFVTHALHYTWWLILVLVCVFASLVEILLAIAMFTMCHMLLMLVVLGESWCSIAIYIEPLANTMMIFCSYHYKKRHIRDILGRTIFFLSYI